MAGRAGCWVELVVGLTQVELVVGLTQVELVELVAEVTGHRRRQEILNWEADRVSLLYTLDSATISATT